MADIRYDGRVVLINDEVGWLTECYVTNDAGERIYIPIKGVEFAQGPRDIGSYKLILGANRVEVVT